MFYIKNVTKEDVEAYWKLRLEALRTNPTTFGASYEDSLQTPMSDVLQRIKDEPDNYMLMAFTEKDKAAGMIGFRRELGIKFKHKGIIWGVYVAPEYRGIGIAQGLLKEVINRGKELEGLKKINLCAVTTNQAAINLYKKLGFEIYGTEKNALQYEGREYDEALMAYFYE
ncbi:GNAT family N-acetyltransferase [Saccharibacillus sp. JS10]|uniref:GNAT family N-acetyltransferase n=1 Tax=Saccharibacillus sp. JS10 TaxID=2950552 RepID=UPI00210B0755|nr:GNAT family N-acetyltransferase [Saccharibacillus sp. JS10]MCQ4088411.1 GNAT family N-acetyltransferase [Saccharibacillus sp. JS10]